MDGCMLMSKSPTIMCLAKQTSKNNPPNAYSSMDFLQARKRKEKRKHAALQDTKKLVTGFQQDFPQDDQTAADKYHCQTHFKTLLQNQA